MKAAAFFKKELLDALRSGKALILAVLFVIFGIMNPAIANLTPWMMNLLAEELANSGMAVTDVVIDASTSWMQFYKNIPMALIVYIVVSAGIFTKEYQSGTLVLMLTKGLKRSEVVISKTALLVLGWTAGYFLCFLITYAYNAYFWDNSVMTDLGKGIFAWWLFGMFAVMLTVFFSTLAKSSTGVMLGCAGVIGVSYILGMIPRILPYTPTSLMNVTESGIMKGAITTGAACIVLLALSIPIMNKKEL